LLAATQQLHQFSKRLENFAAIFICDIKCPSVGHLHPRFSGCSLRHSSYISSPNVWKTSLRSSFAISNVRASDICTRGFQVARCDTAATSVLQTFGKLRCDLHEVDSCAGADSPGSEEPRSGDGGDEADRSAKRQALADICLADLGDVPRSLMLFTLPGGLSILSRVEKLRGIE